MNRTVMRIAAACLMSVALAACGGGDDDDDDIRVVLPNTPGIAAPGNNQSVAINTLVNLDGSASASTTTRPITYSWVITARPARSVASLNGATTARPSFTPDLPGTYVVSLTVNDGVSNSAAASVTVTAANTRPVANAGPPQSVLVGTTATFDGSASVDANNDVLRYYWRVISRPAGSVADINTQAAVVRPTFTPDLPGTYVAELSVSDATSASSVAIATLIALPSNALPVAVAGDVQAVASGASVVLDGRASAPSVAGQAVTYAWSFASRPAGSAATLLNASAARPSFVADASGVYTLDLVVNDGTRNSAVSTVSVHAFAAPTLALLVADSVKGGFVSATLPYDNGRATLRAPMESFGNRSLATVLVKAIGGDFTLSGTAPVNSGNSSLTFTNFNGFDSNAAMPLVVRQGDIGSVSFLSGPTRGVASLKYGFVVVETGQSFTYSVDFESY